MRKNEKFTVWDMFPQEFKDLCIETHNMDTERSNSGEAHKEALSYLRALKKETNIAGMTTEEKIIHADYIWRFFSYSMLPLECYEDMWQKNLLEINMVLNYGITLLDSVLESDKYLRFHRNPDKIETIEADPIAIRQDFDMLLCFFYFYTRQNYELKETLKRVVKSTTNNVRFAISIGDKNLKESQPYYDFYLPGYDYWQEPLVRLSTEFIEPQFSEYVCISYYQYLTELISIKKEFPKNDIVDHIREVANDIANNAYCDFIYDLDVDCSFGGEL